MWKICSFPLRLRANREIREPFGDPTLSLASVTLPHGAMPCLRRSRWAGVSLIMPLYRRKRERGSQRDRNGDTQSPFSEEEETRNLYFEAGTKEGRLVPPRTIYCYYVLTQTLKRMRDGRGRKTEGHSSFSDEQGCCSHGSASVTRDVIRYVIVCVRACLKGPSVCSFYYGG